MCRRMQRFLFEVQLAPFKQLGSVRAAYGLQYHIEVTELTVGEWSCVPAYAESLEATMGAESLARLEQEMTAVLPSLNWDARTIYDNFMGIARGD